MTPAEKFTCWKRQLKRLGLTPKTAAARLGINSQTAYNWNSGQQAVPEKRLRQLEAMK
jgi:DNA-binding transcriptional regulator YiaG